MTDIKIGYALCGSFCTFAQNIEILQNLAGEGYDITPIMSFNAYSINTRFGNAADIISKIEEICGKPVIHTIEDVEPIGPKKMLDLLLISPCTGNTLAKLASSITDTPVVMAAKSQLRNNRPVLIAISTNDALSGNGKNIGVLLNQKNYYFVPLRQDDPENKPASTVADFTLISGAIKAALEKQQLQPLLLGALQEK